MNDIVNFKGGIMHNQVDPHMCCLLPPQALFSSRYVQICFIKGIGHMFVLRDVHPIMIISYM